MKFFNTVGPINPKLHYFLPHRLNWEQLEEFIEKQYYFVLHAPRQSGKTTAAREFIKHLNSQGNYTALYINVEMAHTAANDAYKAVKAILFSIKYELQDVFPKEKELIEYIENLLRHDSLQEIGLYDFLRFWSQQSSKPLVLFFDEFDGLIGDSLISILKQFRQGYTNRPAHFPQTICLIGIRDLRDCKVKTKLQEELGVLYSPFNIKAESLKLANFTVEQVNDLYKQHTQETEQKFTIDSIEYAHYLTQGQPWLVNALAYQACFRDVKDRSIIITKEIIEQAKNTLIMRGDTHIDSLLDRLKETRVRPIIDAIISGSDSVENFPSDDISFCIDLGILSSTSKTLKIANPIYQEIIPRELSFSSQRTITQESTWYQNADGSLDMHKLLVKFQQFYRENSEIWLEKFDYKESGPHLLLMAFLQRIINGGGFIHREYALGRKRVDLLINWHQQRIVLELKLMRGDKIVLEGLEQTAVYMDKSDATEGHLIIFDCANNKKWDQKIFYKLEKINDHSIHIWGV